VAYRATTEAELVAVTEALPGQRARWRAVLGVLRPRRPGRRVQLEVRLPRDTSRVTLGRSSECDVVVEQRSVSRFHAELRVSPGGWTVRDLGSVNGTWLNGIRVLREARVGRGDVLRLGGLAMELRLSER
jgi:pSer/pThr/pTyr-binding forkhead associated (FHA) protein